MEDPGPNSWAGNQPSRGSTACHQLGSQPGGAQHDEGEVLPKEENVAEAFYNTREQGQSAQAGIPRRWELENGAGRQQDRTPWGDRHRGRAIPRGSTRASWQEHPKRAGSTPPAVPGLLKGKTPPGSQPISGAITPQPALIFAERCMRYPTLSHFLLHTLPPIQPGL